MDQLPRPSPALIVETASTLTGSGGGGTLVYPWEEPRALTNQAGTRLQTCPHDFIFHGGKESVRKPIRMAVPPKGASPISWLVRELIVF